MFLSHSKQIIDGHLSEHILCIRKWKLHCKMDCLLRYILTLCLKKKCFVCSLYFVPDMQYVCLCWRMRFRAVPGIIVSDGKGVIPLFFALLEAYKKPFFTWKWQSGSIKMLRQMERAAQESQGRNCFKNYSWNRKANLGPWGKGSCHG